MNRNLETKEWAATNTGLRQGGCVQTWSFVLLFVFSAG